MVLNSYAKLNLYLRVLEKRKDGFHNLQTLFERIDLCDKIILKERKDNRIKIISSSPDLPKDARKNIAFRSAQLLQDRLHIDKGADIRIIKRIPVAAGLGGGSSNAACVLMGLNKLWRLGLSRRKLAAFASRIGKDVPFFIYDCPFALASAAGDRIRPLEFLNRQKFWHILVVPRKKVLTARIYSLWDGKKTRLTRPRYNVKILPSVLRKRDLSSIEEALFNSLEALTFRSYPGLELIKKRLKKLGLKSILMSGSGPAIFSLVSSRKEAAALFRQLKVIVAQEKKPWQCFMAQTR